MNREVIRRVFIRSAASALTCLVGIWGATQAVGQPRSVRLNEVRQTGFEFLASPGYEPQDVAVTPDGKLIFSVRALDSKYPKVMQLEPGGQPVAFPSPEWAGNRKADGTGFNQVVGLACDENGVVWILDRASRGTSGRIVGWDTKANKVYLTFSMGNNDANRDVPFLQDLALDSKRKLIYLAGAEKGAKLSTAMPVLAVIDPRKKSVRVIRLQPPDSRAESPTRPGEPGEVTTKSIQAGLNVPITLDPACEWVYFGFRGRQEIWCVKADELANPGFSAAELSKKVVDYGTKPISNSIAADDAGNVYVADEGRTGVGVYLANKEYRITAVDSALKYPNSLTLARDGYLYVSVKRPTFLNFDEKTYDNPYYLARIKPQVVTRGN